MQKSKQQVKRTKNRSKGLFITCVLTTAHGLILFLCQRPVCLNVLAKWFVSVKEILPGERTWLWSAQANNMKYTVKLE